MTRRTAARPAQGSDHGTPERVPADWQEQHSPTEPVEVLMRYEGSHRVTREAGRRRIVDARLWDALDEPLQQAMVEIHAAFAAVTAGLACKAQNFDRVARGFTDWSGRQAALVSDYFRWKKLLAADGASPEMAMDVLAEGRSCMEVDRNRGLPKGRARANLVQSLKVYARMRGWL